MNRIRCSQQIREFKDDIMMAIDGVMKELENMREDQIITTNMNRQVNDHEERLEVVEDKIGIVSMVG